MEAVTQIDPAGLKARMDARQQFCLLDVREPWEVAQAGLPGSVCIPLHEIPSRLEELDAGTEIIVMCQAGARSQRLSSVNWRVSNGTSSVKLRLPSRVLT